MVDDDALQHCGVSSPDDLIEPNPDIAGIGIMISFISIGLTVYLFAFLQLVKDNRKTFKISHFVYPPGPQPPTTASTNGVQAGTEDKNNSQDCISPSEEAPEEDDQKDEGYESEDGLGFTLFGLGDTQFATGFAISIAALTMKDITTYHWFLSLRLAWLAFQTSTVGLFSSDKFHFNHFKSVTKTVIRIILMWAQVALCLSMEIQKNTDMLWAEKIRQYGPYWDWDTSEAWSDILLIVWAVFELFAHTIQFTPFGQRMEYAVAGWARWSFSSAPRLFHRLKHKYRRLRETDGGFRFFMAKTLVNDFVLLALAVLICPILWLSTIAIYSFFFQPVITYLISLGFFIWGVQNCFQMRKDARDCMNENENGEENEFGFGQVVALMLLISPLINNADLWAEWIRRKWRGGLWPRVKKRTPTTEVDARGTTDGAGTTSS